MYSLVHSNSPIILTRRDSDMFSSNLPKVLLTSLFVLLVACSPAEQEGESAEVVAQVIPLEGTNWQLVQLTVLGGFTFVPKEDTQYVLNFRSGNRLTGTLDCNSVNGTWQQEETALHFMPFSPGSGLCPPGSLHSYLALYLKDVDAYSLRDEHLVLTTPTEGVEIELESRD